MYRNLVVFLLLGLLATGASAERLAIDVIDVDQQYLPVESTHKMVYGDSVSYYYTEGDSFTTDYASVFAPGVVPAWINFQFEEEATTLTAWIRFKEFTPGTAAFDAATYTWGDWVPVLLGGEYRAVSLKCGLWESCAVHVIGSANGFSNFYWFVEGYRD